MFGSKRMETSERPQRNIRELVNADIPLEKTPAADMLVFQVERNIAEIQREKPKASVQMIALGAARRMFDIGTYQRLSGQPIFGPKSYERIDSFEDMQARGGEAAIASAKQNVRIW